MDFQAARYLNEGDTPAQAGNDHPTSSPMGLFEPATAPSTWAPPARQLEAPVRLPERAAVAARPALRHREAARGQPRPAQRGAGAALPGSQRGPLGRAAEPRRRAGRPGHIPQVFEDEQVRHLGVAQSVTGDDGQAYRLISQPVTLTRTPAAIARPAPGWGSTPTRCWPKRATTPPASRACARRAWYDRRVLAGRRPARRPHPEALRDGIATLTISNPARRNAMTLAMWRQLAASLARLREARTCGCWP